MKFEAGADIWGIGNNKISVKQKFGDGKYYEKIYDYKWLSTKGFSKVNKNFRNLRYPYYEGDDKNEHRSGTVLMRTSDEYKSLKYGDKKVEE